MNRGKVLGILLLLAIFWLNLIFWVVKNETKKEVHQLSKKAQVVRDYLDGKRVKGNEAWWLCQGSEGYSIAAHVSMELGLNE